jgi:hypothetical protein
VADNVLLNSGTGGATAAADDVGGFHHQRVKISVGADGTATDGVPVSNGLDSTATGILAVGPVGQLDDVATGTVTENQFAPLRITSARRLMTSGVLEAGTAAFGKLAANSGVDIGDVDVTSSALPTGASTSAKQDTIIGHVDGIEGLLSTIDADTSNLSVLGSGTEAAAIRVTIATDSTGVLSVDDNGGSLTVDGSVTANAGTNLNTSALALDATLAGVIKAEDAAHGSGHNGIMALGVRNDAGTTLAGTDGDYIPLSIDANGALRVTGGGGGTEYTEDAAAAANPVGGVNILVRKDTPTSEVSADGDNIVQRGSAYGAAYVTILDSGGAVVSGSTQYTEDVAAAGDPVGPVILAIRRDTLSTSEVSADGDNIALKATSKGQLHVDASNGLAHDAVDAGNGPKITAKAETSPKGITLVADADRTDLYADADGMLMVKLNTSGADIVSEAVSNTDGSSTAFTNFSAVASTKNYITAITVFRSDSGSSLAYVDFRDGTAGSVLWRMPLPPNGGSVISSPTALFKTSANTALAFDVSSALTTVYISASGYQSKV